MKQKVRPSFFKSNTCWNLTIVLISVLVLAFYVWTVGTNGVPLIVDVGPEHHEQIRTPNLFPDISPHHYGFYNLMADAFEAGQMDLLIQPPKEMLELQNPRDPEQNAKWRILDLSIYKDKYYIYFGPVPTLLLFLPFRWLGVGKISEPLGVAIFSYGIYLCALYIILYTVKKYIPRANKTLVLASILAIAFSSAIPYNLRHPVVYEIALASSAFFVMLGLAFILRAWNGERCHKGFLLAGSCALGLSVGCRPIYLFAAIFLFFLWILLSVKKFQWKESLLTGVALSLPFIIINLTLAIYNYVRFDSFSQFGIDFQTNATLWDPKYSYRLANVAPGIFLRALCPPHFSDIFPFIHLRQFYPLELPEGYSMEEVSAGFLVTTPIILLFLCLAPLWIKQIKNIPSYTISVLFITFGLIFLIPESYMMFCNSMRYQLDFAPYITLGALLGCLQIESDLKTKTRHLILRTLFYVSIVSGIVIQVAFGLTGIFDTFRRGEPRQYFALENFFRPVSKLLTPLFGADQARIIDVTTPNGNIRSEDGSAGIWLGQEGIHIRISSPNQTSLLISGNLFLNPNEKSNFKLVFRLPNDKDKEMRATNNMFLQQRISLLPGINTISLYAIPEKGFQFSKSEDQVAIIKNLNISQ